MKMVKIRVPDKKESAKALVQLSGRDRVLCFADDVYIVPEQALETLDTLGIHYLELGRAGDATIAAGGYVWNQPAADGFSW